LLVGEVGMNKEFKKRTYVVLNLGGDVVGDAQTCVEVQQEGNKSKIDMKNMKKIEIHNV
jgi:hypothetical protein